MKVRPHVIVRRQADPKYRLKVSKPTKDSMTASFSTSIRKAIQEQRDMGLPIAKYDTSIQKAYLEYPNGERKYVEVP